MSDFFSKMYTNTQIKIRKEFFFRWKNIEDLLLETDFKVSKPNLKVSKHNLKYLLLILPAIKKKIGILTRSILRVESCLGKIRFIAAVLISML